MLTFWQCNQKLTASLDELENKKLLSNDLLEQSEFQVWLEH